MAALGAALTLTAVLGAALALAAGSANQVKYTGQCYGNAYAPVFADMVGTQAYVYVSGENECTAM